MSKRPDLPKITQILIYVLVSLLIVRSVLPGDLKYDAIREMAKWAMIGTGIAIALCITIFFAFRSKFK